MSSRPSKTWRAWMEDVKKRPEAKKLTAEDRRKARRKRREKQRGLLKVLARWGAELADKPPARVIAKWIKRYKEYKRGGKIYPAPPREWLKGLVGLKRTVAAKNVLEMRTDAKRSQ